MTGRPRATERGRTYRRPETDVATIVADGSPALRTVVAAVRAAVEDESADGRPGDGRSASVEEPPALPTAEPDWEHVLAIARRHQVVPLVYRGLSAADASPPILDALGRDAQENAKRNLHLAGELARILGLFDESGIRAIPYKGPVLAAVGYGDLHRRTFLDLDLLVAPEDVFEAGRTLRANGYVPGDDFVTLRRFGRDLPVFGDPLECRFFHAATGNEVELRWRLGRWTRPFDASFDELWRHRATTTMAGRSVPILSPEDRLVVLAHHGTKHAWQRLEWLADVAVTVRDSDLDWPTVRRRVRAWNAEVSLHAAVILVESLFESDVPTDVRRRAYADRRASLLAGRAASRLVADPRGTADSTEEFLYELVASESVGSLPGLVARHVFQPRLDEWQVRLPRPLWPAYVLGRVARTAKVAAGKAVGLGESLLGR